MRIDKLNFKNISSYGNKLQTLDFEKEGSLNLIVGKNGAGKCVHPDTEIDIKFESPDLEKEYLEYLDTENVEIGF